MVETTIILQKDLPRETPSYTCLKATWMARAGKLLPRGSNVDRYSVRVNGLRRPPLAEADVLPDPELTPFTLCYKFLSGLGDPPSLMVGGAGQGGVGPAAGNSEPTVLD
jgi:hypothetical protein